MKVEYRGYQLEFKDGKIYIGHSKHDLDCGDAHCIRLEEAISWINEDIRCREEENENRIYLDDGDKIYVEGGYGVLGKDNIVKFIKWHIEARMFFEDREVFFDDDDKAYVKRSD